MKTIKKIFLILILFLVLLPTMSNAVVSGEKILNYKSEIYINEDASMIVEETITVYAGGNNIKRGIYRDFPTKYKDKLGNKYNVKFEVLEVFRDGEKETYRTENQENGVRVYIGDSNKILTPGYYTYTIKYETSRQIGYFDDHDELYWNVTGNGWSFTIDSVEAIVHLPDNVDMSKVKFEAYTGLQGSTEKEYTASKNEYNNTVTFYTTSTLQLQEGLTIVVGFEKGLVHEPTIQEYISYWFEDNKEVLIGILGATITIVYCIISWYMVGRDPKKDIIIPRYSPPEGLSPSEVKYIDSMGKYDKVFESSILNLAVKGYIKIEKKEEKKFKKTGEVLTLIKQDKTPGNDLSEDEIDIYNSLPQETKLEYNILLHGKLTNMQNRQKKYLYKEMNGKMYSRNIGKISISIIMSIITIIFSLFMIGKFEAFSDIFVVGWMIIFTFIFAKMVIKKILSLDAIIFILPFFGVELVMLIVLAMNLGFGMMMLILLLAIINSVYAILIRAYTKEGRRIKDEIEGFKLFIKTASEDEMKVQTPETFDKYFPYAYVLGLENEWAKNFEKLLEQYNYEPTWCTGMDHGSSFRATAFTYVFSSRFRESISSASVHPSSFGGGSGFSSDRGSGFSSGGRRRRIFWWRWPEAGGGGGW